MPRKERQAKNAAFAMAQELNSEMTEEEQERMLKSGMGIGGGIDKGETELFAKKLSKEEKKALAEKKKAERDEKKEAEKALQAKIARNRAIENGETPPEEEEEEAPAESSPVKKLTAKEKKAAKEAAKNGGTGVEGSFGELDLDDGGAFKHAICTGILLSRKDSKDVKIGSFSISLFGQLLFDDQIMELTYGHRYGLVAQNGSGKSTLLKCIASRSVPIPDFVDIWFLDREAEPTDRTAMETVIDTVREEKDRLEKLEEDIMSDVGPEDPRLEMIYEKLEKIDPSTFEKRAGELLFGLGFSQTMMARATKDMSGGWRMRVALAQALFVSPMLLVLDEPTNHLDLGACVWLEDYLSTWSSILLMTSHSQDFLNGVCSKTYHLSVHKQLTLYGGNFDNYVKTRRENEVNQQKKHEKEQDDIKHLKEFINSCGTYSNLVKQAQSKQKIIDKMTEAGLTPKVEPDPSFRFKFPNSQKLPPPVMAFQNVSFAYSGKKEDYLYKNLEFGVDCDSRIALVGPNGAGKSTLLKLMLQELLPTEGDVRVNAHLRIGRYNQHSEDVLDLNMNPLDFMDSMYPDGIVTTGGKKKMDITDWRGQLGQYGISGKRQTLPMVTMSPGFRARVVFCLMSLRNPQLLLLDEPTNPLDMDMIDSLAMAMQNFEGGVVLVSHDFRLLEQVADTIWVCDEKKITPWTGTIQTYKGHLRKQMAADVKRMQAGKGVQ